MKDIIYIIDAIRTPIGKFFGQYQHIEASWLGAATIRALLSKTNLDVQVIDEVIMGQVLTASVGMNPARQAGIQAGLPVTTPAYTVNQVCGSSLRAIIIACCNILVGQTHCVIAGGQENMTRARHSMLIRHAPKLGDIKCTDTLYEDGLKDYFHNYLMGVTAENVAKKYDITRQEQDNYALRSQFKTEQAIREHRFDSQLVDKKYFQQLGLKIPDSIIDEYPRPQTTIEKLSTLKPVFQKEGTVTAGNASGINDGASTLLLCDEVSLKKHDLQPKARILGWRCVAVDPAYMGIAPIQAAQELLHFLKISIDDIDLIEINEAFAATTIAVNKVMKWDEQKINCNGGAIALGHPIGASGARIVTTLIYELQRQKLKKGLASLCIGGGMGIAILLEII